MTPTSRRGFLRAGGCAASACVAGCFGFKSAEVVVYTAHDRSFSEPLFAPFEAETGIRVRAKYDTESTKTIGLVNAIRTEARRPRCDVFWNNELLNTLRLQHEGLLAPYFPKQVDLFPPAFRDPQGHWTGFAARARVLLVNTERVAAADMPHSVLDLTKARWRGQTAMAKPLFGTTATHAGVLWGAWGPEKTKRYFTDLTDNAVQIRGGNKQVAQAVASGSCAFGLTDTDDARIEMESGKPVRIVYPDSAPGQMGTLFIPNTAALLRNAPHPAAGKALLDYLLSPQVEEALARGPAAQIPLNTISTAKEKPVHRGKTPADIQAFPLAISAGEAARNFEEAADWLANNGF